MSAHLAHTAATPTKYTQALFLWFLVSLRAFCL